MVSTFTHDQQGQVFERHPKDQKIAPKELQERTNLRMMNATVVLYVTHMII